jgi:hypothetical protein
LEERNRRKRAFLLRFMGEFLIEMKFSLKKIVVKFVLRRELIKPRRAQEVGEFRS